MKQTSIDAHKSVIESGLAGTLKSRVYDFIIDHPNCTQKHITELMGESARKRVAELVRADLIIESGKRRLGKLEYTTYRINTGPQLSLF